MKDIKYKTYSKKQMLDIIQNKGFVFVETSLDDNYMINLKDIPDFIVLESNRTKHKADISMYIPGIDSPVLTTFGCYLNRLNSTLREEIIDKLILLQTNRKKPKKVKIFNNYLFMKLSTEEQGIENGKTKNFDTLYARYVK